MDVSIIIVNYNTLDLIKQCISSIIEKTNDITYEIIVVDNCSIDGSQQMITNDFPDVVLIENNENLGFGRANNLGIENSKGKYLLLLNSDTIFLNNALLYFYDFMETNNSRESIGAIGGLLLDLDRKPTVSDGDFPSILNSLRYIGRKIIQYFNNKSLNHNNNNNNNNEILAYKQVDYIIGADLFIPKKIFKKLDGFDYQFFMYFEDADLQKRMAKMGLYRLIIPGPEIIHLEGGSFLSSTKLSFSRFSLNQISLKHYMRKHYSGLNYVFFRFFMILIQSTIIFDHRFNFNEKIKALRLIIIEKH